MKIAVIPSGVALLLGVAAGYAFAASAETCSSEICVSDAWARATPPGAETASVYFSVVNKGRVADSLVSASTSVTANAMVHRSVMDGNIVRMEMTGPLELAPGARVTFAPIGYHLMLAGLKQPLAQGATISVTLDFAKAGKLQLAVPVLGLGAAGPKSR
jgi:copper(I)-binding protein